MFAKILSFLSAIESRERSATAILLGILCAAVAQDVLLVVAFARADTDELAVYCVLDGLFLLSCGAFLFSGAWTVVNTHLDGAISQMTEHTSLFYSTLNVRFILTMLFTFVLALPSTMLKVKETCEFQYGLVGVGVNLVYMVLTLAMASVYVLTVVYTSVLLACFKTHYRKLLQALEDKGDPEGAGVDQSLLVGGAWGHPSPTFLAKEYHTLRHAMHAVSDQIKVTLAALLATSVTSAAFAVRDIFTEKMDYTALQIVLGAVFVTAYPCFLTFIIVYEPAELLRRCKEELAPALAMHGHKLLAEKGAGDTAEAFHRLALEVSSMPLVLEIAPHIELNMEFSKTVNLAMLAALIAMFGIHLPQVE